jgi:hypothetical protein
LLLVEPEQLASGTATAIISAAVSRAKVRISSPWRSVPSFSPSIPHFLLGWTPGDAVPAPLLLGGASLDLRGRLGTRDGDGDSLMVEYVAQREPPERPFPCFRKFFDESFLVFLVLRDHATAW